MLEEKLSKINENIPEFKDKENLEQKILNKHHNEQKANRKKHRKISTMFSLQLSCIIFLLTIITSFLAINTFNKVFGPIVVPPTQKTEYEIEQEKRAELYSEANKNFYVEHITLKDKDQSEYTEYLIEQNKKQEDSVVTEDIYYKVTIDYKNGRSPEEIIVKSGELVYPEVFSYSGHYFLGWFVDEKKLTSAIPITKDTYIYAKWSIKESVTIEKDYYEYYESYDGAVIVSSKLEEKEVIEIPSHLNNLKVVGMENGAFSAYYHNNSTITKEIIIPDSVKYIGSSVFNYYLVLEKVTFPKELEELMCNAFSYCSNIKTINIGRGATNFKVVNNCLIDKRTNTLIKGCNNSIIPDGIKTIEKYAFAHIEDIKELVIPESVSQIKASAFSHCTGLEKVVLPENLLTIDESLFYDCINLKEVYIGKNVSSIKELAFMNCSTLEKIVVSADNPCYVTLNNCLVEKETMKLIAGANVSKIPNGIKIIGRNSFYGRINITSLEIPNTVTEIEEGAFFKCINLKKAVMENSVRKIGGYVFTDCYSLEEVILPEEVESFGSSVFDSCKNLKEIVLPKGIKKIPSFTFSSCEKLERIVFNDEITSVGAHAFSGCSVLKPFDLSNVTYIGGSAFAYCRKFTEIDLSSVIEIDTLAFFNCRGLKKIYIPSTVKIIKEKAFENCSNAVIYCEDLEKKDTWHNDFAGGTLCFYGSKEQYEYKDFVFIKCDDGLELIKYYGTDQEVIVPEYINDIPVTVIGENVFEYKEFNKITLPDTITLIKPYAFIQCENLKSITMPKNLKIIDNYAFFVCNNLTEVVLNEGLEYINHGAFASCDIIKIVLPSTLKEIASSVFSSNFHLVEIVKLCKNVKIQSSNAYKDVFDIYESLDYESCIITNYEGFIFYYYAKEDKVYLVKYYGDEPFVTLPSKIEFSYNGENKVMGYYIRDYAFNENKKVIKVYTDKDSLIFGIGDRALFACYNLTSFVVPSNCEYIGYAAFSNCNHLYEVFNYSKLEFLMGSSTHGYIAFNAKVIIKDENITSKVVDGNNGFIYYLGSEYYIVGYYGNSESINLPNNISGKSYKIASDVFRENKTIKSVQFTSGVESIGAASFRLCLNLKEIYIPASVKFIGKHAFSSSGLKLAVFEDPNNWLVPDAVSNNRYQSIDLSNAEENAKYLNYQYHYFVDWIKE